MNNVILIGRLTKDSELRYTQSNKAVATFTLAIDRPYSTNGQPTADFINIVVWDKSAENVAKYTHKGSLVAIDGRIQTRNYKSNGRKIYVTEVLANRVQFLDKKENTNENTTSNTNQTTFRPEEVDNMQMTNDYNDLPF